jgi:hypothetical protein
MPGKLPFFLFATVLYFQESFSIECQHLRDVLPEALNRRNLGCIRTPVADCPAAFPVTGENYFSKAVMNIDFHER